MSYVRGSLIWDHVTFVFEILVCYSYFFNVYFFSHCYKGKMRTYVPTLYCTLVCSGDDYIHSWVLMGHLVKIKSAYNN